MHTLTRKKSAEDLENKWRNSLQYKSIPNKASWKVIHLFLQQIPTEYQIHSKLSLILKLG